MKENYFSFINIFFFNQIRNIFKIIKFFLENYILIFSESLNFNIFIYLNKIPSFLKI
jgi:hypothetical protein